MRNGMVTAVRCTWACSPVGIVLVGRSLAKACPRLVPDIMTGVATALGSF